MSRSLSDELFDPLRLDDLLTRAHATGGGTAATGLLERVLGDPRSLRDALESVYLDELIDYYEAAGRYADAIAVAYRMLDRAESWERPRAFARLARLYADNDEPVACRATLDRVAADIRGRSTRQLVLSPVHELVSILERRLDDPPGAVELLERVLDAVQRRPGYSDLDGLARLRHDIAERAGIRVADRPAEDPVDEPSAPMADWWSEVTRIYPDPPTHPDMPGDTVGHDETNPEDDADIASDTHLWSGAETAPPTP